MALDEGIERRAACRGDGAVRPPDRGLHLWREVAGHAQDDAAGHVG
jgi:hypothetical protein